MGWDGMGCCVLILRGGASVLVFVRLGMSLFLVYGFLVRSQA